MQTKSFRILTAFLMFLFLQGTGNCSYAAEQSDDGAQEESESTGVVESSKMFEESEGRSAETLLVKAESAYSRKDLEHALILVKRSLKLNDDDIDAHCLYAKVLQDKLQHQDEKDTQLFATCVKEWLLVLRNKVGPEKGINTADGLGFMNNFYRDEDHTIAAKHSLVKLVGSLPKSWETDNKYLKRVLAPTAVAVSGHVLKKKSNEDKDVDETF
jgi:hypothetical protein